MFPIELGVGGGNILVLSSSTTLAIELCLSLMARSQSLSETLHNSQLKIFHGFLSEIKKFLKFNYHR